MNITCHTDQAGIYGFRVHGISGDWVKGGSVYSYGVAESLRFCAAALGLLSQNGDGGDLTLFVVLYCFFVRTGETLLNNHGLFPFVQLLTTRARPAGLAR